MGESQAIIRQVVGKPGKRGGKRSTSWKPGQSGNPKGIVSKRVTFTQIIRELAETKDQTTDEGELVDRRRAVIEKLYNKAIKDGDFLSIKYIIDRADPEAGINQPSHQGNMVGIFQAIIMQVTNEHADIRENMIRALENAEITD